MIVLITDIAGFYDPDKLLKIDTLPSPNKNHRLKIILKSRTY